MQVLAAGDEAQLLPVLTDMALSPLSELCGGREVIPQQVGAWLDRHAAIGAG